MKPVQVAIVGAGQMGIHHIRNYSNQTGVEIVAVVDRDEKRLAAIATQFGVPTYMDHLEILESVDAVSIVTPTVTHFSIARDFLMAGKHVLLEKPMTATMQEAQQLKEIANANGAVLMVGHIERFNPAMQELRNVLAQQKPLFIDIHRESPYDPRIYDTDVILDLMIHDIDLLNYVLDEHITLNSAYGVQHFSQKSDLVNAQLSSGSGVLINLVASRATEQKLRTWRMVLPQNLIEVDLIERKLFITKRTAVTMEMNDENGVKYKQEQIVEKVLVPNYEPLQVELSEFIKSVRNGSVPKVTAEDGAKALRLGLEIRDMVLENWVTKKSVTLV